MPGESWTRSATGIALAVLLLVPTATGSATAADGPDEPIATAGKAEARLAEPLLQLTDDEHQATAIQAASDAGQAWSQAALEAPPDLDTAIADLYAALDLPAPKAIETNQIPQPFHTPLATLLQLETLHATQTGPYAHLADDPAFAFTLGAFEPIQHDLTDIRHRATADPLPVDPLGLVILGGSTDNTYTPNTLGPTTWQGPILLIEPDGNDTYEVPVAAPTTIHSDTLPYIGTQHSNLALELGGNDTYHDRTASADLGAQTQAILLDRDGHDTYATTDITRTTAHASPGYAYLRDDHGNDTYRAEAMGIAHAERGGTAILWDQHGHDNYTALPGSAVDSHAMADSRQARTLIWDEEGDDEYNAHRNALGFVRNDGTARLVDERGDDTYEAFSHCSSIAIRYEEPSRFLGDGTLGQGLGEFIDANGHDTYRFDRDCPNAARADNDMTYVDNRSDRKYGVFIDCTTPADAHRPCPGEQHDAGCTMAAHPQATSSTEPIVHDLLTPVETECKQAR